MNQPLVLIVEDEEKIASLLCDYLQAASYDTHWIADGNSAVAWVKDNNPDIVLLDIMLPGADGLSICRELRSFSDVAIVMVTARVDEIDRLLGLELGADDYICKPFSGREVVARVKAILRRSLAHLAGSDDQNRGLHIDEAAFEAKFSNTLLDLTPVEFRLLALLAEQPNRVFSRDQLISCIYTDGRVVSDRTVDSHVKNLRKKLVDVSAEDGWIRSVYGVGYKLD